MCFVCLEFLALNMVSTSAIPKLQGEDILLHPRVAGASVRISTRGLGRLPWGPVRRVCGAAVLPAGSGSPAGKPVHRAHVQTLSAL